MPARKLTPPARRIRRKPKRSWKSSTGWRETLSWAVEGALPRDLEERYRGGETHLYVRRLYEGGGRKLVAAVEQRYEAEKLMRGRVDAYLRVFERLLDTVSAVPQGEQLVDACLASESGKLYLMLAQASGRIRPQ